MILGVRRTCLGAGIFSKIVFFSHLSLKKMRLFRLPEAVLPEKDEDETANDEGEDNQGTRNDLPNKHICKEQTQLTVIHFEVYLIICKNISGKGKGSPQTKFSVEVGILSQPA